MIIGIGNVGSTSLKSKIIDIDGSNRLTVLGEANLDRITSEGISTFSARVGSGQKTKEEITICGYKAGIQYLLDWYVANGVIDSPTAIQAMGFKTVMGVTNGANKLTSQILEEMRRFVFVAPVHNQPYIDAIGEFSQVLDVPMVGVFEPSFHGSMAAYRRYFGLPWAWHEQGIYRLGFHGSSHRYLSAMAYKLLGSHSGKVISVHLGGSSSLCAIEDGRSVDCNQAFSPNSGFLQGTRSGDIDGTALLYAMKQLGLSIEQAQQQLSTNAGLRGMAGIGTDDMRAIQDAAAQNNERAAMTLDLYVDGIRKDIAGFAAGMGGVDAIVFGGGIGENNVEIRQRCLERLEFMGVTLDSARNEACIGTQECISTPGSAVKVFVVPTNEEVVVAHFTKRVVELGRDLRAEEMQFRL